MSETDGEFQQNLEEQEEQQPQLLHTFLQENFSRVFSLLGSIFAVTVQNESNIRQILNNLQQTDEYQPINMEFGSRELVENILRTGKFNATSSNKQKLDDSLANEPKLPNDQGAGTSNATSPGDVPEQKLLIPEASKPTRKRKSDGPKIEYDPIIHCSDCNQIFKRGDGTYTKHLKEVKCRPYECPECKKRFRKKGYMTLHVAVHSKNVMSPEKPKVRKVEVDEQPDESVKSSAQVKNNEPFQHFLDDYLYEGRGTKSE